MKINIFNQKEGTQTSLIGKKGIKPFKSGEKVQFVQNGQLRTKTIIAAKLVVAGKQLVNTIIV